jgi:hypothetical protein
MLYARRSLIASSAPSLGLGLGLAILSVHPSLPPSFLYFFRFIYGPCGPGTYFPLDFSAHFSFSFVFIRSLIKLLFPVFFLPPSSPPSLSNFS